MKKFIVAVSSIVLGSASTWGGNQGADATVLVANLANENKIITALSDSNGDNAFVSLGRDRIQDNSYGSGGRIARTRRWWPKGRYYVDKFRNKKLTRPWRINLDESNISMPACKNIRARYQWDSDNNTWGCNQFDWSSNQCDSQAWLIGKALRQARKLTRRNTRNYLYFEDEFGRPWMRLRRWRSRRGRTAPVRRVVDLTRDPNWRAQTSNDVNWRPSTLNDATFTQSDSTYSRNMGDIATGASNGQ